MARMIIISVLFFLLKTFAFSQTEEYSAPVNWQRYAVSSKEVSLLLPKMPVMISESDVCREKETRHYYAYAEEVVYSLKITSKTKEKAPQWCTKKRKFNRDIFVEHIKEIKKTSENPNEEKIMFEAKEVTKMVFKTSSVWLFDDLTNNQWFELSVSHRENHKIDPKAFVESIKFKNKPDGIEIGKGAERTLGDGKSEKENTAHSETSEKSSMKEENHPLMIIAKWKPFYTDAARQANVQGSVTVRVVFLANGGIGSITPVSELPLGLTEQAIMAAQKLVFLPQKKGNQTVTVVRPVQYNFSIY